MLTKLKECSVCHELTVLWLSNPPTCKYCANANKVPVAHVYKPMRTYCTTAIKKVKTDQQIRQAKLNAAYLVLRKVFIKAHPICQGRIKCAGSLATEVHHKRGRGEYLLDARTFLALCSECHHFCEMHPEFAKALGFSEDRLNKIA